MGPYSKVKILLLLALSFFYPGALFYPGAAVDERRGRKGI